MVYKGIGKELKLLFDYNKEGTLCEASFTIYIDTYEKDDSKPILETTKQIPNIKIVGDISIPVGEAGKEINIEIPVKNISSFKAQNIKASIISDSKLFATKTEKIDVSGIIKEIASNKTEKLKINFGISPYVESGDYILKFEFNYSNTNGEFFTSDDSVLLRIKNNNKKPFLVLEKIQMNPYCPLPGEDLNVLFKFENLGSFDAKEVKLTIDGFKEDGIIPQFTGVKYLECIEGGTSRDEVVQLKVSEDVKIKNYPIKAVVQYTDEQNNTYKDEFVYYIPINISKRTEIASLEVENENISPQKVYPNEEFKISLDLKNKGNYKAINVRVWLSNDAEIISKSLNTIMINSIEAAESEHVEFVLEAREEAVSKNYPIAINIEYEDDNSNKRELTQYVGILVDNKNKGEIVDKSVPKIIIENYTLSPKKVLAGEEFKVDVDFVNTHKSKDACNVRAYIAEQGGEVLPTAGGNGSIYIEEIKAGSATHKTISFSTNSSTEPKNYFLNVDFDYEDKEGNSYLSKESLNVPITQKSSLIVDEVDILSESSINRSVPVYVDFYNTGRAEIKNLFVECKGDFEVEDSVYFVGNLESGAVDYYEATIVPKTEGLANGRIIFTYEDSDGEKVTFEKEFSINIAKASETDNQNEDVNGNVGENSHSFSENSFLILLTVPFVVGIILLVLFRFVKKTGKESINDYENV